MALTVVCGAGPVHAMLRRGGVAEVLVARSATSGRIDGLVRLATSLGVAVTRVDATKLDRMVDGLRHQGILARVEEQPPPTLQELLAIEDPEALLLVLVGVQDPRNLGATIRSAVGAGARGILLGGEGMTELTPAVHKAAAGATALLPPTVVSNLPSTLKALDKAGFWVVGISPDGERTYSSFDLTGRVAVVVGGEARGLPPSIRKHCHAILSIPMAEGIESLNATVAASIVLFDKVRQRKGVAPVPPPQEHADAT